MTGASDQGPRPGNGREPGWVLWVTGLPGSGKTSVGSRLWEFLRREHPDTLFLDGDGLRQTLARDLGYTLEDRRRCAARYSRVCLDLSTEGSNVVIATVSLFHDCHRWNRTHLPRYFEIYLKAKDTVRHQRCTSRAVVLPRPFVGIDLPYEVPTSPDLVVDNDGRTSPAAVAGGIWRLVAPRLSTAGPR